MILYCCTDLMFSSRIGGTATGLGLPSRPVSDTEELTALLTGRAEGGETIAGMSAEGGPVRALFVDLDLGEAALELIATARRHDSALPVIAFGSHVEADLLRQARARGADPVLPRSRFVQQLPHLLEDLGR